MRASKHLSLGLTLQNVIDAGESCAASGCTAAPISALNLSAQLGALLRLRDRWSVGLSLRTANNLGLDRGLPLPWVLNLGGRYAHPAPHGERFDLEIDAEYRGQPRPDSLVLPAGERVDVSVTHSVSVRLGGAFYPRVAWALLALRAGLFADLDVQRDVRVGTSGQYILVGERWVGATLGLGLGWRGGMANLAYCIADKLVVGFAPSVVDHAVTLGVTLRLGRRPDQPGP